MDVIFYVFAAIALVALFLLVALLNNQKHILRELKKVKFPEQQKIEFPEFPKIEIPPAKEVNIDLQPVIDAIKLSESEFSKLLKFPEFPKVEIPPAKEVIVDMNPVIEAINNIKIPEFPEIKFPTPRPSDTPLEEGKKAALDTELLKEIATLMRVNQAEFQSGLEAFHKAIDKLLAQIPNGEKELDAQKEFIRKFEEALVNVEQKTSEAMNENSLRLQEILTEFLNVQK